MHNKIQHEAVTHAGKKFVRKTWHAMSRRIINLSLTCSWSIEPHLPSCRRHRYHHHAAWYWTVPRRATSASMSHIIPLISAIYMWNSIKNCSKIWLVYARAPLVLCTKFSPALFLVTRFSTFFLYFYFVLCCFLLNLAYGQRNTIIFNWCSRDNHINRFNKHHFFPASVGGRSVSAARRACPRHTRQRRSTTTRPCPQLIHNAEARRGEHIKPSSPIDLSSAMSSVSAMVHA